MLFAFAPGLTQSGERSPWSGCWPCLELLCSILIPSVPGLSWKDCQLLSSCPDLVLHAFLCQQRMSLSHKRPSPVTVALLSAEQGG